MLITFMYVTINGKLLSMQNLCFTTRKLLLKYIHIAYFHRKDNYEELISKKRTNILIYSF